MAPLLHKPVRQLHVTLHKILHEENRLRKQECILYLVHPTSHWFFRGLTAIPDSLPLVNKVMPIFRFPKLALQPEQKEEHNRMKRILAVLVVVLVLSGHDMYLKPDHYFLDPNTPSVVALYNGTFEKSENVIDRDRMLDVSIVGNGQRITVDTSAWVEKDDITYLNFTTGAAGTWVAGVSTKPRTLGMSATDFNEYLEHDGVLDMLALRNENGTLADSAIERYSKHVKTIFQVGDELSDDYQTELGYPIEFVLLDNPYDIHPGHTLPVKLLFQQQPLANQLVYAGLAAEGEHTHADDESGDHQHDALQQFRTDEHGMLDLPVSAEGIWYLRTIHLAASAEEGLTHESHWATVTFAVGEGHSHEHEAADEEHSHDEGLPVYIYVILSVLIIGVLFFWFNRKK